MENKMDIKALWNKQTVPAADQSGIFGEIKSFRRKGIKKIIILNTILLLTVFFVVFVWIYFEQRLLSTQIGIILTILPIVIVALLNHNIVPWYKRIDERRSNFDYLNDLLVVKNKESFMQTKVMSLYFILLSVGISLYIYEYTVMRSLRFGIAAYFILFLWIGFNWFYLRPKIIRKNKMQIDNLIKEIEKIKSQLD